MSVDPDGQARRTQAVTLGVFTARVRERYAASAAAHRKDDFVFPAEFLHGIPYVNTFYTLRAGVALKISL